jgi:hypothetical protein
MQACIDAQWGACQGQVLPAPESCQNPGQDNDCDGEPDDIESLGKPCIDSQQQGQCRMGTMQCSGSTPLPVCVGRNPEPEQCDPLDHNCNGNPYDGIDLNSNQTCGDCQTQCSGAQMCCSGGCRSPSFFAENDEHCGACNNRCGALEFCCQGTCVRSGGILPPILLGGPTQGEMCRCETTCGRDQVCCFDKCVDLDNDPQNCGFCGNRCSNDDVSSEPACRDGGCLSP